MRITRLNWDIEYLKDLTTGNGFLITEPATFSVDEEKMKSINGSRSILYGTSYEDENAFIERYRCKCGAFTGKLFEGEICPICGKKVEYKDANIEFTGWISLGNNYVINPYFYNRLSSLIGKNTFAEIINRRSTVDVNGIIGISQSDDGEKPKHPYVGIGLIDFRLKFEEVMKYFKSKKPKKAEEFDRIISESSSVWTSHIPVYSTLLRPQSFTSDTYYFNSIDKHINPIFSLSEKLKNPELIDRYLILSRIQIRLNKLWDINFDLLNTKDGWIRGQVIGGSLEEYSWVSRKTALIAGTLCYYFNYQALLVIALWQKVTLERW